MTIAMPEKAADLLEKARVAQALGMTSLAESYRLRATEFAPGDGNSSAAKSARAKKQLRDRLGRWIFMGGKIRWKSGVGAGSGKWNHGEVVDILPGGGNGGKDIVTVKMDDGKLVTLEPKNIENVKAKIKLDTDTSDDPDDWTGPEVEIVKDVPDLFDAEDGFSAQDAAPGMYILDAPKIWNGKESKFSYDTTGEIFQIKSVDPGYTNERKLTLQNMQTGALSEKYVWNDDKLFGADDYITVDDKTIDEPEAKAVLPEPGPSIIDSMLPPGLTSAPFGDPFEDEIPADVPAYVVGDATDEEITAAWNYIGDMFGTTNNALRAGDPPSDEDNDLVSLMKKFGPLGAPTTVFRGTDEMWNPATMDPGDVIPEQGFLSTSKSKNAADVFRDPTGGDPESGIMWELNLPEDFVGLDVTKFTGVDQNGEQELLGPYGSKLEIISDTPAGSGKPRTIKANVIKPDYLGGSDAKATLTDAPKFEVLNDTGKSGDGYHSPGQWGKYGAAGVLIRAKDGEGNDRFLLVQRGPSVSSNVGKWQLPGGALDEKENPYQATARETVEELKADKGYLGKLKPMGESVFEGKGGWKYTNIAADADSMFTPDVDGTETGDAKWFTADELDLMMQSGQLHPALVNNIEGIFEHFNSPAVDTDTEKADADDLDAAAKAVLDDEGGLSVPGDGEAPDPSGLDTDEYGSIYDVINTAFWEKTGGATGSNPGGFYTDDEGKKWYVKESKSPEHAKNEVLAAALYRAAGIDVPKVRMASSNGKVGIASPILEGKKDLGSKLNDTEYKKKIQQGYAVDAWLSNWDVAGTGHDNIITGPDGEPLRVDVGGSLLFRAMGGKKGNLFAPKATELDSLIDPNMSAWAAPVYKGMDADTAKASAQRVANITPEQIDELVDKLDFSPENSAELKDKLKSRREDVMARFGVSAQGATPDEADEAPEPDVEPDDTTPDVPGDTTPPVPPPPPPASQVIDPPDEEPYLVGANGDKIHKGDIVKSTKDGFEGEVVMLEPNGQYIKVKGLVNGKMKTLARKRDTLALVNPPTDDDQTPDDAPTDPPSATPTSPFTPGDKVKFTTPAGTTYKGKVKETPDTGYVVLKDADGNFWSVPQDVVEVDDEADPENVWGDNGQLGVGAAVGYTDSEGKNQWGTVVEVDDVNGSYLIENDLGGNDTVEPDDIFEVNTGGNTPPQETIDSVGSPAGNLAPGDTVQFMLPTGDEASGEIDSIVMDNVKGEINVTVNAPGGQQYVIEPSDVFAKGAPTPAAAPEPDVDTSVPGAAPPTGNTSGPLYQNDGGLILQDGSFDLAEDILDTIWDIDEASGFYGLDFGWGIPTNKLMKDVLIGKTPVQNDLETVEKLKNFFTEMAEADPDGDGEDPSTKPWLSNDDAYVLAELFGGASNIKTDYPQLGQAAPAAAETVTPAVVPTGPSVKSKNGKDIYAGSNIKFQKAGHGAVNGTVTKVVGGDAPWLKVDWNGTTVNVHKDNVHDVIDAPAPAAPAPTTAPAANPNNPNNIVAPGWFTGTYIAGVTINEKQFKLDDEVSFTNAYGDDAQGKIVAMQQSPNGAVMFAIKVDGSETPMWVPDALMNMSDIDVEDAPEGGPNSKVQLDSPLSPELAESLYNTDVNVDGISSDDVLDIAKGEKSLDEFDKNKLAELVDEMKQNYEYVKSTPDDFYFTLTEFDDLIQQIDDYVKNGDTQLSKPMGSSSSSPTTPDPNAPGFAAPVDTPEPPAPAVDPKLLILNEPHVGDAYNTPIFNGTEVKSLTDGTIGTVVGFEPNGSYVKVQMPDGKIKARSRKKLVVEGGKMAEAGVKATHKGPNPSWNSPGSPAAIANPASVPAFTQTPGAPSSEATPEEVTKWAGKPMPPMPTPSSAAVDNSKYFSPEFLKKLGDHYKAKTGKNIEASHHWSGRLSKIINNGSLTDLDYLRNKGGSEQDKYFTPELYEEAKTEIAARQAIVANNAALAQSAAAQHQLELDQWQKDIASWQKANGLHTGFTAEGFIPKGLVGAKDWTDNSTALTWTKAWSWAKTKWSNNGFSTDAIYSYTGSGSGSINSSLYSVGKPSKISLNNLSNASYKSKIKQIDTMMENAPIAPMDYIVHRGVSANAFKMPDGSIAAHNSDLLKLIGTIQPNYGFSSTSVGTSAAFSSHTVQMKIRVPKEFKSVFVGSGTSLSQHSSEREMILDRGARYYIHSAKFQGGKWWVEAEIVPDNWMPDADYKPVPPEALVPPAPTPAPTAPLGLIEGEITTTPGTGPIGPNGLPLADPNAPPGAAPAAGPAV